MSRPSIGTPPSGGYAGRHRQRRVKSAADPEAVWKDRHQFSVSLEQGKITNQKQSGRCWMFAALNTMRFAVMKKLDLETFELSQNYTLFYDKLEKANYFLESILETLDQPVNGRLVSYLLSAPLNDGGAVGHVRELD